MFSLKLYLLSPEVSWLAAESLQILSVGWLVVTHNPRYSVTNINQRDRLPGLRIDKVDLGDSGEYQCQVVGPAGTTTTLNIRLQVCHLHLHLVSEEGLTTSQIEMCRCVIILAHTLNCTWNFGFHYCSQTRTNIALYYKQPL